MTRYSDSKGHGPLFTDIYCRMRDFRRRLNDRDIGPKFRDVWHGNARDVARGTLYTDERAEEAICLAAEALEQSHA